MLRSSELIAVLMKRSPPTEYDGDPLQAAWFPNATIARSWLQYVKGTAVVDTTPPPAPTNRQVTGNQLRWKVQADLESGLAHLPEKGKNPYGRHLFHNLLYSDTSTQPLAPLQFTDANAEPGKQYTYRVIAVNTVGLKSKLSSGSTVTENNR